MNRRRILFIAQHRPGRSPSQRFRFEQYLRFFEENGYDCDFSYLISAEDDKVLYAKGNLDKKAGILARSFQQRQEDAKRADDYDIVFVQREAFMTGTTLFERKFSHSKARLVFDFDDSIWLNNVSEANKYLNFLKKPSKTSRIIAMADHVIAGNAYLADYARPFNNKVSVIPTTIDTDVYVRNSKPNINAAVTIGWSGSITTIQHFNHAVEVLRTIKSHMGDKVDIRVIGDANYVNHELGIKGMAWNADTEIDDLGAIDIGIMPLPDDEWAKGKCGLKGLQYMALEIPTIMSPVGVNEQIIRDGENGFLASNDAEWYLKLQWLIQDAELRKKLGMAGRQTVIDHYSVNANAHRYLEVFDEVLSR